MIISYDPLLVILSVLIAICGGYTCFHLMDRLTRLHGTAWKTTLVAASIAIGGGIWAMHFVGMLALHLPVSIRYDLQQTLLSALIAVGVTAVALYLVTIGRVTHTRAAASGVLLGCGISGMHYVGMAAIRGGCSISYGMPMVTVSVLVGIGASIMALYLALRVRNKRHQVPAAIAMGLGIAGMHYTAMFAASFAPAGDFVAVASPVIDNSGLAVIITVVAFFLLGSTFLLAAPVPDAPRREPAWMPASLSAAVPTASAATQTAPEAASFDAPVIPISRRPSPSPEAGRRATRIPVQAGRRRTLLEIDEVVCVQAYAHYTKVCSRDSEFFCSLSMADVERRLQPYGFLRVHRSHLVKVDSIRSFIQRKEHGDVVVQAAGKDRHVPVSRGKLELLKATLGGGFDRVASLS